MIYKRKEQIKSLNKKLESAVEKDYAAEDLQHWVMYGIDFENRTIDINSDIDEQTSNLMRRAITKFVEIDRKAAIKIMLSTYGGDVIEMFSIIDFLKSVPCPIIMIANGKIMSAGLPIFLAGDIRLAYPNTRFMMHSLSHKVGGKLKDTEIDVKEGIFMNNVMLDMLAANTKKTKKWWEAKVNSHDFYFGTKEAKEFGVIQEKYNGQKGKIEVKGE